MALAGVLFFQDLLADPFKACQALYQPAVIGSRYGINQVGAHDGLNHLAVCRYRVLGRLLA